MINFTILKKSKRSDARLGVLQTSHGVVETPTLVPVATNAVVRTLEADEAASTGAQMLIANTYHLHRRPGERVVKAHGGLHDFMRWNKPLMTDSGGFQVFSLGFGRDHKVGKILKSAAVKKGRVIKEGDAPQNLKITADGVEFRSLENGDKLFLGPKESIRIQELLGADIIFAFDECTPPLASHAYTATSLLRTHAWARICLEVKRTTQALFGIVQGGRYRDLRLKSARAISSLPFDGFGIGGEFGNSKQTMDRMLRWVLGALPEEKPRHLLGIGTLEDIPKIIRSGVDFFDCTVPTHLARHGVAFTSEGQLDMFKVRFLKERRPLDRRCACAVCTTYDRSYVSHLVRSREITGLKLLTMHNLTFFNAFVAKIRADIKRGNV